MEHTPGPWTAELDADRWIITGDGSSVALLYHARASDTANARLIAAAPDLLDLARLIAAHFEGTDAPLGIKARALIDKAEGRL